MYIYQRSKWPEFTWDNATINHILPPLKFEQGRLIGRMESLGFDQQQKATLETLTNEIIKSSEIEGETLDPEEVRSSIARHLGIDIAGLLPSDRHVDGIVEVLLDATRNFQQALTMQRLCGWHALLFPSSISGLMIINPGILRNDSGGPMQVVSGSYGREKVHFQAPAAQLLPKQIKQFLQWFNKAIPNLDPLIKAAIAHLWFVTLHPFDDGNGRLARAITDMALASADNLANRFYSMSRQIRKDRKAYYEILERTQKGQLDITPWLQWFLQCLQQAILQSETILKNVLNKTKFWEQHSTKSLNKRQTQMLNTLFDGFKGKLTSSKWAKMMNCSQDSANRDINNLIELDILIKSPEGGRSTSYLLKDYPINLIN